jgi:hypothetical protein
MESPLSEAAPPLTVDEPAPETPAASTAILSPQLMTALLAATFLVAAEARVIAPVLPAIAQEFQTSGHADQRRRLCDRP